MLDPSVGRRLDDLLGADDAARAQRYPGPMSGRQPVHTVYVPADRVTDRTPSEWGAAAVRSLDEHGPLPGFASDVEALVRAKLSREPIEDLRIDFEDGYGHRADEDDDVRAAAAALARMTNRPEFSGLRIKSLEAPTRARGVRSLDLFLDTLLTAGALPAGFRVTLPKVTSVRQVEAMAVLCQAVESAYGLARLPFEIQIETPQAVLGPDGTALVAPMITAAEGRCVGLHYGTYDYSAALGIAAAYQSMEHPAADHAKAVLQVAAAGTGVPVSDGSTNMLPIDDHVRTGWQEHARLVRRSLERGFYQGWDLHPAQLPTRFAATFAFFRSGFPGAADRLRAYLDHRGGSVLDEPATARGLAGYVLRGVDAGAVDPADAVTATGCDLTALAALAGR